jgi:GT2 family glycosyltransferase
MDEDIDLSVLICSTHTRWQTFGKRIQEQVWAQYEALSADMQMRVEILMLTDNKAMMLGHKRNVMVDAAQGRYVVFVDDDDRLEPDYLDSLLSATSHDADVITFLVNVSINGGEPKICRYSKDFRADHNTTDAYHRLPNHICAVKRELVSQVSFPNLAYGEDSAYSKLLHPLLDSEFCIDRVLYHYDYADSTTETQQHRRNAMRRRKMKPIVDVIILSKATSAQTAIMTQRAVDTCVMGANSLPVNVIVLEQNHDASYRNAQTVHMPEEFNYNGFANHGAGLGSAKWIMVANNDLIFHDGWLHQLLAARYPVVSPKCPRDPRQEGVRVNTTGYRNAVHFSGWCFMLTRQIWERIEHFDDRVTFWCSDDAVIEQLRAIDTPPMLVPNSTVEHVQSVTLNEIPEAQRDLLTWGNVEMFNELYGQRKFGHDSRFHKWLAAQQHD